MKNKSKSLKVLENFKKFGSGAIPYYIAFDLVLEEIEDLKKSGVKSVVYGKRNFKWDLNNEIDVKILREYVATDLARSK